MSRVTYSESRAERRRSPDKAAEETELRDFGRNTSGGEHVSGEWDGGDRITALHRGPTPEEPGTGNGSAQDCLTR